jgi:hypothetical protein
VFEDVQVSFVKHNEGANWRRAHLDRECWILLVGPPLDNWSTKDVTAVVCKFGRLLAWENDANHKGRIIDKIRCDQLREIPKSIRLTEGKRADSESWTFSIEILQQNQIVAGPQDEDPLPADGVDPHAPAPPNFHQNPVPLQEEPVEEDNWGDGHWALGGHNQQQHQVVGNVLHHMQIDPLDNLLNAMDVVENFEAPDNFQNNDASSITLTDPISTGDLSSNVPIQQNAFNMDVYQVPQNPAQMENANMAIDLDNIFDQQVVAPVIVNGNLPALNFDNFPVLGVGVQNLMLAYHEAEPSSEDENMAVENSGGINAN